MRLAAVVHNMKAHNKLAARGAECDENSTKKQSDELRNCITCDEDCHELGDDAPVWHISRLFASSSQIVASVLRIPMRFRAVPIPLLDSPDYLFRQIPWPIMMTGGSVTLGTSQAGVASRCLRQTTSVCSGAIHAARLVNKYRKAHASNVCCSAGCSNCIGRSSTSIHALSSRCSTTPRRILSTQLAPSLAPRSQPAPVRQRSDQGVVAHAASDYAGLLFFAPGLAALAYGYIVGKGNVKDGLSRLLTLVSQVSVEKECHPVIRAVLHCVWTHKCIITAIII